MQYATIFAISLALASGSVAAPAAEVTSLEERQTGISSAFLSFAASEFQGIFGEPPPCCDDGSYDDVGMTCWAATANHTTHPNDDWILCYTPDTKDNHGDTHLLHSWSQDDIDISKCLTDLHAKQSDVCIDVKGSSCEDKSYTGNLQNMRESSISGHKLSSKTQTDIKKAMDVLKGQKIVHDKIQGFNVGPVFGSNPKNSAGNRVYDSVLVRYVGEDDC